MTVWNGTWKPDGTGGWHTKSDIVDQYNSARLTQAPAQMLKDAIDEVIRLRERLAEADECNRRVSDESEKLRHELITSSDAAKYYDYGYSCARDMQKDEITRLRAENEKLRNEVMSAFFKGYDQGVKAERERCAKIAERYLSNNEPVRLTASSIAAAIRESME